MHSICLSFGCCICGGVVATGTNVYPLFRAARWISFHINHSDPKSLTVLGISVHNSFRHCFSHLSGHLDSRSQMNLSTWLRTFSISMAITVVKSLVILFSVPSLPMSDSWVSWQRVHLHLSEVFIVTVKRQIAGIEINWWGLPVITICYIFLVLVLGEEGRVIIGHLRKGTKKISLGVPFLIAPR